MSLATAEDIQVLPPPDMPDVRRPSARPRSAFLLLAGLFAVAGIGFIGQEARKFFWTEPVGLIVVDPDRFLDGATEGEGETFVFRVRNPTWHEIRIVGTSDRCSSAVGCSLTKPIPLAIPAGEARDLEVLFKAGVAPYHFKLRLFTSDAKQPEILLSFSS